MLPAPAPRARRRAAVAALIALLFGFALRAPLMALPLERDEGEYAYVAWRWLEGETPYVHTINQKPPAVFAAYAAFLVLLGRTPEAIHLGFALWLGVAQLLLFAFAFQLGGIGVAFGAAVLFAVISAAYGFLGNAAQVEGLASLPIVAAAWLAHRGARTGSLAAAVGAGAACGVMLLFKPVTAPIAALTVVWLAFGARRSARLRTALVGAAAAGGVAVLGAFVAYFASADALGPLWDSTVRFNVGYARKVVIADYFTGFAKVIVPTLTALGPLYLVAVAAPVARRAAGTPAAIGSASGFVTAWLLSAVAAAGVGGYFRGHAFLYAAAPLALAASAGVADLATVARAPAVLRRHAPWLGALLVALLSVAAAPWYHLPADPLVKSRRLYGFNPFAESSTVAAFIAERSEPDDRLFIFGSEPQIQFLAQRRNTGRYLLAYHYLFAPPDDALARQREVLAAIRAEPPRFIATALYATSLLEWPDTPRELHRGLDAMLRADYRPIAEMRLQREGLGSLETRPDVIAPWRDRPGLESGNRSGWLVLYERHAAAATRP